MVRIKIKKIKPNAIIPSYSNDGDSGVDLYSCEEYVLKPGERCLVSTGLKIEIPRGYEAQIRPKSGLALNHGISVCNTPGTIDASYRGEVGVIAINHGQNEFKIERGKKIAQMIIAKVEKAEFVESDLNSTVRGESGFGSTGL